MNVNVATDLTKRQSAARAGPLASARVPLVLFAAFACANFVLITAMYSNLPLLMSVGFAVITILLSIYFTSDDRYFVLPLFWLVLFICGYLLSWIDVLVGTQDVGVSASEAGVLLADDYELGSIFALCCFGLAGIVVGMKIAEKIFNFNGRGSFPAAYLTDAFTLNKPHTWVVAWVISSVVVIASMAFLGIGRTGLEHDTELPFRLSGILVFYRNIGIPFLGFLVFIDALHAKAFRRADLCFSLMLTMGAVSSLLFFSRGSLVISVGLFIFPLALGEKGLSRRTFVYVAATILMFIVTVPLVNIFRASAFDGSARFAQGIESISLFESTFDGISQVMNLVTSRIVGLREFVLLHRAVGDDMSIPVRIFFGDEYAVTYLQQQAYGWERPDTEGLAFGYAFGLWGGLYAGGSYLTVLAGTALFAFVIMMAELVLMKMRARSIAIFVSCYAGLWFWAGVEFYQFIRLAAVFVAIIVVVRWISPGKEKRRMSAVMPSV